MEDIFVKSFLAGLCIALGGVGYLQCPTPLLGSLLFAFGLIIILNKGFSLYTGKIGYCSKSILSELLVIFLGNLCGAFLMGCLFSPIVQEQAQALLLNKNNLNMVELFSRSVGCGMIMYLTVSIYNKNPNVLIVIVGIMLFILSGYEHCIAYIAYCGMASDINFNILGISILGNSLGSIFIYRLEKLYELFQLNISRRR